jgi:uncharacterized protein YegP (UPF0339 family)
LPFRRSGEFLDLDQDSGEPRTSLINSGEPAVAHTFEIVKDKAGEFRVRFKYNSEVMFSTEGYSSKASAKAAIESIKKNGPGAPTDDATD